MGIFRSIIDWFAPPKSKSIDVEHIRFTREHWDFIEYMIDSSSFGTYKGKRVRISFGSSLKECKEVRNHYLKNPNIFVFRVQTNADQFIKDNELINPRDLYFFHRFVYVKDEKLASYLVLNGEKMLPMENFKKEFPELFDRK